MTSGRGAPRSGDLVPVSGYLNSSRFVETLGEMAEPRRTVYYRNPNVIPPGGIDINSIFLNSYCGIIRLNNSQGKLA